MRIFASFAALPVLAVLSVAVPACDKGQPAATPPADAQNDDQNSADGVLQLPDDSPLSLTQLCCQGETGAQLSGCLGPARLVGTVGAANECLEQRAQLLSCAPERGGWTCLPATDDAPQLCTCGATYPGVHASGLDDHTWSQRTQAAYRAHAAEDAEPRPLCCDAIDEATRTCSWDIELPSLFAHSEGDEGEQGKGNGKRKGTGTDKGKGTGTIRLGVPSDPTPPRGPIELDEVAACEASGAKIMTCEVRKTSCEREQRLLSTETRRWSGACTCEG